PRPRARRPRGRGRPATGCARRRHRSAHGQDRGPRSSACRARSALDPEGVGARDDGRQGPDGAAAPRGGLVGPAARPQRLRRRAGRDRRGVAAQRFATTRYSRRVAQRVPAVGAVPARLAIRDRFLSAFDRRTALTAGAVWAVWLGAVLAVVI